MTEKPALEVDQKIIDTNFAAIGDGAAQAAGDGQTNGTYGRTVEVTTSTGDKSKAEVESARVEAFTPVLELDIWQAIEAILATNNGVVDQVNLDRLNNTFSQEYVDRVLTSLTKTILTYKDGGYRYMQNGEANLHRMIQERQKQLKKQEKADGFRSGIEKLKADARALWARLPQPTLPDLNQALVAVRRGVSNFINRHIRGTARPVAEAEDRGSQVAARPSRAEAQEARRQRLAEAEQAMRALLGEDANVGALHRKFRDQLGDINNRDIEALNVAMIAAGVIPGFEDQSVREIRHIFELVQRLNLILPGFADAAATQVAIQTALDNYRDAQGPNLGEQLGRSSGQLADRARQMGEGLADWWRNLGVWGILGRMRAGDVVTVADVATQTGQTDEDAELTLSLWQRLGLVDGAGRLVANIRELLDRPNLLVRLRRELIKAQNVLDDIPVTDGPGREAAEQKVRAVERALAEMEGAGGPGLAERARQMGVTIQTSGHNIMETALSGLRAIENLNIEEIIRQLGEGLRTRAEQMAARARLVQEINDVREKLARLDNGHPDVRLTPGLNRTQEIANLHERLVSLERFLNQFDKGFPGISELVQGATEKVGKAWSGVWGFLGQRKAGDVVTVEDVAEETGQTDEDAELTLSLWQRLGLVTQDNRLVQGFQDLLESRELRKSIEVNIKELENQIAELQRIIDGIKRLRKLGGRNLKLKYKDNERVLAALNDQLKELRADLNALPTISAKLRAGAEGITQRAREGTKNIANKVRKYFIKKDRGEDVSEAEANAVEADIQVVVERDIEQADLSANQKSLLLALSGGIGVVSDIIAHAAGADSMTIRYGAGLLSSSSGLLLAADIYATRLSLRQDTIGRAAEVFRRVVHPLVENWEAVAAYFAGIGLAEMTGAGGFAGGQLHQVGEQVLADVQRELGTLQEDLSQIWHDLRAPGEATAPNPLVTSGRESAALATPVTGGDSGGESSLTDTGADKSAAPADTSGSEARQPGIEPTSGLGDDVRHSVPGSPYGPAQHEPGAATLGALRPAEVHPTPPAESHPTSPGTTEYPGLQPEYWTIDTSVWDHVKEIAHGNNQVTEALKDAIRAMNHAMGQEPNWNALPKDGQLTVVSGQDLPNLADLPSRSLGVTLSDQALENLASAAQRALNTSPDQVDNLSMGERVLRELSQDGLGKRTVEEIAKNKDNIQAILQIANPR